MMRSPTTFFFLLLFFFLASPLNAAVTIEIRGGAGQGIPLAVLPFSGESPGQNSIAEIAASDLARSGLFRIVPAGAPPPTTLEGALPRDFLSLKAQGVVLGRLTATPQELRIAFRLLDPVANKALLGLEIFGAPSAKRRLGHRVADLIYEAMTGKKGPFSALMAYVTRRGGQYALRLADSDGWPQDILLSSSEPILSPVFSPRGDEIAYVSFESKRPVIYLQHLASGSRRALTQAYGQASAPAFSPSGAEIAFALLENGESHIHTLSRGGGGLAQLTSGAGLDTEPCYSPDGRFIYFTSDRGGSPQIYRLDTASRAVKRITFSGAYNTSPAVTPDGRSLIFVHRDGGGEGIAVLDLASGQMRTISPSGGAESPSVSPDGRMVVYSAQGWGRGSLRLATIDGRVEANLEPSSADIRDPAWGPLPP